MNNNNGRLIIQLLRMYSFRSFPKHTVNQSRSKFEKRMQEVKDDFDDFHSDDMDVFESDFMNIGQSYTMHKKEMQKSKEKLKQRIVKEKYFKEEEPKFLTFTEKDQIQKLHQSNPEEWTPERLSESFPALPEAIKRVLKATWLPKSVDKIIKYDTGVIENWKNLKTGKLVVNPVLHAHLMKFRNRKIVLSSREALSEFVPKKMELPKPRSSLFSNIIKSSIDEKQPISEQKLIPAKKEENEYGKILRPIENNVEKSVAPVKKSKVIRNDNHKSIAHNMLTYNEFMKKQLKQLYNTSPEEGITLLQTYRQHIESNNFKPADSNVLSNAMEEVNEKSNTFAPINTTENVPALRKEDSQSKVTSALNMENNNSLDTFIKERKMCIDTKNEYIKPIKIPKNVWKHGMTYRVKDCYYDYDGEFLYRVPGVLT